MTISRKPLQIPTQPRPNFRRANWQNFQTEVTAKLSDDPVHNFLTQDNIDYKIDRWYDTINTASSNNIPTTTYKTLPHTHFSHATRTQIAQFTAINQEAITNGWSYDLYRLYKQLQVTLQPSLKADINSYWAGVIAQTASTYNEPSTFWRKTKQLMDFERQDPHYLYSPTNAKIYSDIDKEALHRHHWSEVFTDNNDLWDDEETAMTVRTFLTNNLHRTYPYPDAGLTRLNTDNDFLTLEISDDHIKSIIKKMIKSCPGESGISKSIFAKLPPIAIIHLRKIFNASLSLGYFPGKFKEATLKLIPKRGKNPHHTKNFRPIFLLEVPGKIFEIINHRIRTFLEENNKQHSLQFGFRPGRGTTHALALVTEDVAQSKADGDQ